MNSFLQCLFMTKEYRKDILEASTLAMEAKVLEKMKKTYSEGAQTGVSLPTMARQMVRPLA